HVLEADGIEHARGGGVEAGGGGALDGVFRKAFGDEAAEAGLIDGGGKFEAVTEGAAGSENRIPQAQRANLHAKINRASGTHFGQNNMNSYCLRIRVAKWRFSPRTRGRSRARRNLSCGYECRLRGARLLQGFGEDVAVAGGEGDAAEGGK